MSLVRCYSALVLVCAVTACSSGTTPSGTTETSGSACTVTFGDGAATAKVTSCSVQQSTVGDSTVVALTGNATGLDSPTYAIQVTFPSSPEVKTYTTDDLVFVWNKFSVPSIGARYDVLFDPSDTTKPRYGSVTATFTSASHGTMDVVYQTDRDFYPTTYATARITF